MIKFLSVFPIAHFNLLENNTYLCVSFSLQKQFLMKIFICLKYSPRLLVQ
jgi:hypothetical protein